MSVYRNYSGLNQYFPRNALFLPPEGGRNSAFRVGKMDGLSSYGVFHINSIPNSWSTTRISW